MLFSRGPFDIIKHLIDAKGLSRFFFFFPLLYTDKSQQSLKEMHEFPFRFLHVSNQTIVQPVTLTHTQKKANKSNHTHKKNKKNLQQTKNNMIPSIFLLNKLCKASPKSNEKSPLQNRKNPNKFPPSNLPLEKFNGFLHILIFKLPKFELTTMTI